MSNILVTGATGFVGQYLIKSLMLGGHNIRVISRRPIRGVEVITCDFLSDDIPGDALKDIDTVFHLAGHAHDLKSISGVENIYQKINVNVTNDLLSLSLKHNVKKFIFVSSVKAGGKPLNGKCATENYQGDPDGEYGKTKRKAELKVLEFGKNTDMHVSILRPALIYGPRVKGNLKLMASGIKRGWFPPLPEIGNTRSMIHVDDVVRALLLLSDKEKANGKIFIATDDNKYSSRGIYEDMCYALGKKPYQWSVPYYIFRVLSLAGGGLKYKINKLLGNECYSSIKLQGLGFKAQKRLQDINETDY